jgi:hypothetical protein
LSISLRRGSATALKASEVVAARAMNATIHSHIGMCQVFIFVPQSSLPMSLAKCKLKLLH